MAKIKANWDINPAFGGPILRDRLWFFGAARYTVTADYVAGLFWNRNTNNPDAWTFDPDTPTDPVQVHFHVDGRYAGTQFTAIQGTDVPQIEPSLLVARICAGLASGNVTQVKASPSTRKWARERGLGIRSCRRRPGDLVSHGKGGRGAPPRNPR